MYVFGPINSIRLGRTLYVNVVPGNVCSYNCIYCHRGVTPRQASVRERYYPDDDILAEIINRALHTSPRHISFIGEGEPTLCRDLGRLVAQTRQKTRLPVVVCTNGSLLFRKDVRQDLAAAEVVIMKIDAGEEPDFLKINRPLNQLDYQMIIGGMIKFRTEFDGQVWLDVMLIQNVNDSQRHLDALAEMIGKIRPGRVYVRTLCSPPAEPDIYPADESVLDSALARFGECAPSFIWQEASVDADSFVDARQAILDVSRKHPLAKDRALEVERAFAAPGIIAQLLETRELIEVEYDNVKYLSPSGSLNSQKKKLSPEEGL